MPNEHIEEWKRFAKAYLRWVNFSFDRTVADVVKKHTTPARAQDEREPCGRTG